MASGMGRCINFGSCTKADTKQAIPMGGVDAVCPECGKPLTRVGGRTPRGGPGGIGIVVLIIALLAIVGGFFGLRAVTKRPAAAPVAQATPQPATAAPAPTTAATAAAAVATTALRLCGSNTIGSQLGPDLAKGYLGKNGGTQIAQSDPAADEHVVTATANGGGARVSVSAHGSATAFGGLSAGSCDVGMASRAIKPDEVGRLRALGDMTSRANEHVIGLDGIAVIVNPANPVDALTVDQLKNIYTGQLRNWRQVRGQSSPITVYALDAKSGTFDTFKTLVLGNAPLIASAKRLEDTRALSQSVAREPGAIGFVGLPYVGATKPLKIASGGIAIAPTILTVGRETYPLTRRLYLYTAANPKNGEVRRFVDYVQSPDGQRVVEQDGFVGTVVGEARVVRAVNVPANAPPGYASIVRSSEQLPFNFYFRTGSDVLDNKAYVDVGRLVAIASLKRNAGRKIVLVGFADSTGSHEANRVLSIGRASSVRRELISQGVDVKQATGFGDALPIRDNATEDGRQKNRRVEIFLAR